jgi:aerobic carbon-monoxide dehydrogenase medium subunit
MTAVRDFEYLVPDSIAEASSLLAEHGENSRLIAGGTALLLALRQRMVAPSHLISLAKVGRLRGVTYNDRAGLRIGAMTLHAEVARSPLVQQHYPMLADMAGRVANPQVRNQGTIGGNLCYADPATDPPSCLMALDASLVLSSARGDRVMAIADFFVDYYTTALASDEILSEIRVPRPSFDAGYHARFHRTAAEHRPLVNIAMTIKRDQDVVRDARLVVGASTTVPTRARKAEAFLTGKAVAASVALQAAEIAAAEIDPISDIRGSESFRRDMVRVVAHRTIERLCGLDAATKNVA